MSALSTADLDKLAIEAQRDFPVWVSDIIKYARLQVAIDELPLAEGWTFSGVERWYTPHEWVALAHEPGHAETSGGGPTMLAAILALGDALTPPVGLWDAPDARCECGVLLSEHPPLPECPPLRSWHAEHSERRSIWSKEWRANGEVAP